MHRIWIVLFLIALLVAGSSPVAAQVGPVIVSPRRGEVLQGTVSIRGSNDLKGFTLSEVAFSYTGDTTGTWFLIEKSDRRVNLDVLATWDTTTITDGDYVLRLRVFFTDGSSMDFIIPLLRVRNYTPIETPSPIPASIQKTLEPTSSLTATPFPSPTLLPKNPAILTFADVSTSILFGGSAGLLLLVALGFYLWLRRK
jgi:hypothetical protein